jgi:fructokinase
MDLIPVAGGQRQPMVGGGPANTAKAVARLGYATYFVGGISSDAYGNAISAELLDSGVDLSLVLRSDLPTGLAIATIDENGLARYDFELEGSASFAFETSWLPQDEPDVIHIGSVATLLEPGASELMRWLSEKKAPIVFDPNVRPSIQGDKNIYRAAFERWLDYATIVKMSEDDLTWLYDQDERELVDSWIHRGVAIVVITRAEKGLTAFSADFEVNIPAVLVDVVDTVGAGDTIGAILVEGLLHHGLAGLNVQTMGMVLSRAAKAASITCSRAGANPPWCEELDRI